MTGVSVPARGRRYPVTMVVRARQLREAEWSYGAIARLLQRETGHEIASSTIRLWLDQAAGDRQRAWQRDFSKRRASASTGRLGGHESATPEFRHARMVALDTLGVSAGGIARVMNFDFRTALTEQQVRYALQTGRYPKPRAKHRRSRSSMEAHDVD